MLYYHVGKKDDLYLAVLEGAYEKIRAEERGLDLEHLDPPQAIERLIDFTWNYLSGIRNSSRCSNTENLAKARHLKRSTKVKSMHSPFVEMIRTVVTRGIESGDFVVAVDPVQLYISIAALCFFYLSNAATLSVIFGRDLLAKEAKDERLAHMVALVSALLLPWRRACLRTAMMPVEVKGLPIEEYRKRALALIKMVGLAAFALNYPYELSGGMQQRVGLARGLIHDPRVLLMDEPFGALDAMTRERMAIELQRIWMATGKSVAFITHSIPEAVFLSDRVIVMSARPGRIDAIYDVTLPRPRSLDMMADPRFVELTQVIRRHFNDPKID